MIPSLQKYAVECGGKTTWDFLGTERCDMNRAKRLVIVCGAVVVLALAPSAQAQYMFADTNGDGQMSGEDRVGSSGPTTIDIYLVTDRKRDGSLVAKGPEPLSIFSYELAIAAVGGTVKWGTYVNARRSMTIPFGRGESESEIYVGYGGIERLPPGKYKLGTLSLEVKSGQPRLEFRSRSSVHHLGGTTFGSRNPGKDGDHTLKFTEDAAQLRAPSDGQAGDWAEADGVAPPDAAKELASRMTTGQTRRFEVRVGRNPTPARDLSFTVSTTKPGRLVVRLFDVQGRLVRTLQSEANAEVGTFAIGLPGGRESHKLAAGIYLYRVETADGVRTGRVVIVD